jgi:hypothetical protein
MDISWDDQILAIGTEEGTIELYNFNKISQQTGKVPSQDIVQSGSTGQRGALPKYAYPSFIKVFKTKSNGIMLTKFSWRNLLYSIGNYN